jgi:FkbH-like protein
LFWPVLTRQSCGEIGLLLCSMPRPDLKNLLLESNPEFWKELQAQTRQASDFQELFALSNYRKKALARRFAKMGPEPTPLRVALLGAYCFYPFRELLLHVCELDGIRCEIWEGAFDNYHAEIMDGSSGLYGFAPDVVLLFPAEHRCRYVGKLTDPRDLQQAAARQCVDSLIELAGRVHQQTRAEVIMANFMLPARHDLGAYRTRTLGSDWSFRKWVNLELGLAAPPFLRICDIEFLANRRGGVEARDARGWFESKQPCSPTLLVDLARECAHLLAASHRAPKKVLALDLDNTLWGGVVADDGLEGIEIGDTSPRGEAFKAFQKYLLSLQDRGVLLAVCSKNDHARAIEVFERHPEMVLRMEHVAAFKANWEPKSDNLQAIAKELNIGLSSMVFVDDNPAEIEIVRQFAPEVATILLGTDPSEYVAQLQDCRLFESRDITAEDAARTAQYRSDMQRQVLLTTAADMDSYLQSLAMRGSFSEFTSADVPRLAQLINKSNQFNLTTRRRSEAEVLALIGAPDFAAFHVRLEDRFGDHGLISIVIGQKVESILKIDTWLMSCRVLKRQVEDEVLNELVRIAINRGCSRLEGLYLPTAKNEMVRDFYSQMGFTLLQEDENSRGFVLDLDHFQPRSTKIEIIRRTP